MKPKVYVAAPSCDIARYKAFIEKLKGRGMEITLDWSALIARATRHGLDDTTIPRDYARSAALADALGVMECSVLVLLAPLAGQITVGAWVELGIAIGLRAARQHVTIVIVGASPPWFKRQYAIFEELADVVVDDEQEAIAAVERLGAASACLDDGSMRSDRAVQLGESALFDAEYNAGLLTEKAAASGDA